MKKYIALAILVFIAVGCGAQSKKDFNYGLEELNRLNQKYEVDMSRSPDSTEKIDLFLAELEDLRKTEFESGGDAFKSLIDYRIHNLQADRYFIENKMKYGERGTTIKGFGCKGRHRILNSSSLRMMSASEGFKAVEQIYKLVENYPEESKTAGLSRKDALFLNATFYEINNQAKRDNRTIEKFCTEEVYQQLMKEEEMKKGLLDIEE